MIICIKCQPATGQLRPETMIARFSLAFFLIISVAIIIGSALNNNGGNIKSF